MCWGGGGGAEPLVHDTFVSVASSVPSGNEEESILTLKVFETPFAITKFKPYPMPHGVAEMPHTPAAEPASDTPVLVSIKATPNEAVELVVGYFTLSSMPVIVASPPEAVRVTVPRSSTAAWSLPDVGPIGDAEGLSIEEELVGCTILK